MAQRKGNPISDLFYGLQDRFANAVFGGKGTGFLPIPAEPRPPIIVREPVAEVWAPIRTFNYNDFHNQSPERKTTRADSVQQLRNFADACEIFRLVAETRKDQIRKLKINFKLKEQTGESTQEAKKRSETDPRVKELEDFFRYPDKINTFGQWVGQVIEELIVLDGVPLYNWQSVGGKPYALLVADSTTIVKLIDEMGRTPTQEGVPAYQQKINGEVAAEFTLKEMIYFSRNQRAHTVYGFSPAEQVILTINTELRRKMFQLSYYTEGNVPVSFIKAPEGWSPDQISALQELFNAYLSGDPAARAKMFVIPDGTDPIFPQAEVLKDEFDEWLARIICYSLSISPNAFIKSQNRATSEQSREQSDEEGLLAWTSSLKQLIDMVIEKWFGYTDIECSWVFDRPQDSKKQAEIDHIYVSDGVKSRDEVRKELGLKPIGVGVGITVSNGVIGLEDGKNYVYEAPQSTPFNKPEGAPTPKSKLNENRQNELN